MVNKQSLLKGVTDDELKLFLAKGLDRAALAEKRGVPCFSDFGDTYRAGRLSELLKREAVEVRLWGGYEGAERVMAGFYPPFGEEEPFPLCAVRIKYNGKFGGGLTHRDFLGSVLGLGIERGKIGDIVPLQNSALVICDREVADFIAANLERVKRTAVSCEVVSDLEGVIPPTEVKEAVKTVSSLRLDAVIGGAFNISRGAAAEAVKGGRVFINHLPTESVSKKVNEGDLVTLRGKGRVKLLEVLGSTKKDKLIIKLQSFA